MPTNNKKDATIVPAQGIPSELLKFVMVIFGLYKSKKVLKCNIH